MDSARFDALTRSLSDGMTRRHLTRLLGGLTLGLLHPIALEAKNDGDPKQRGDRKDGGTGKGSDKANKTGHETGKHGPTTGQTDTGRHDVADHKPNPTGGDEATAPRDGKTGQPDTAETPTASTAREGTSDLQATDGTVRASATSETCRPAGRGCTGDRQCCSRRCRRGRCRCPRGRAECGTICCPEGQACVDRAVGRCAPKAGSCATGADQCVSPALTCQGGSCSCLQAIDGETRCGQIISTACGICGEHADCRREFGYRAFCVSPGGGNCGCSVSQTFCARQCG